jgi:chemotaxis protein MotB
MMAEERPDLVEKEEKEEPEEMKCETAGGLRWLITYADMITLLLGVFIILVGHSTISETKFKAMATAFSRVFSIFKGGGEQKVLKGEREKSATDRKGYRVVGVTVPQQRFMEQIEKGFKEEMAMGWMRILPTEEGIRIRFYEKIFFKDGSYKIQPSSKRTLDRIAKFLEGIENSVVIEAHTNAAQNIDKWQISSKRTLSILEYLIDHARERGMSDERLLGYQKRLEIAAFADTQLALPKNPMSPKNNRIDIIIKN